MRDGIYRLTSQRNSVKEAGVATIKSDTLRGMDQTYVYFGRRVSAPGKQAWKIAAWSYTKSAVGFTLQQFETNFSGEESDVQFDLKGEVSSMSNVKIVLSGDRVADL